MPRVIADGSFSLITWYRARRCNVFKTRRRRAVVVGSLLYGVAAPNGGSETEETAP